MRTRQLLWLILVLLLAGVATAKPRPPVVDPNTCPYPYDVGVAIVAEPMAWLPADVNLSLVSQMNVWNKSGRDTLVTVEQVVKGANGWQVQAIEHTIQPESIDPIPDPNGGFNKVWTWGFTPTEDRIYYLLFTASTPSKPHWRSDRRIILVYPEPEDVPILWVQDVPQLMVRRAQRLWQASVKQGRPFTKPTLIRLAKVTP
jgi:hypothetical protein